MRKKNRTYHKRGELIHGFLCQDHPLYQTWANMMSRCYDSNQTGYVNYGGRGITVDSKWHHFKNFVEDMYPKPEGLTLDRKDVNGSYEKDNCQWANRTDQCVNRRRFKNNTTGVTGVKMVAADQWRASFDYEKKSYEIGVYLTKEEAIVARQTFVELFFKDRSSALAMIVPKEEVVWNNAKTKTRGVTPHVDGGYISRCTINGVRHYVGYFKTIEEAEHARREFLEKQTQTA